MKIVYLVNQYPQPSHSFIRREIRALEAAGFEVLRFTVRRYNGDLVDPADQEERERAEVVLDAGIVGMIVAAISVLLCRPFQFFRALELAWKTGKRSERGRGMHLIYFGEACVLCRRLRAAGIPHLHAHFGTNSTTVAMLCHELGGPSYSFTAHGPEEFDKPAALAMSEKIERAAFVIAISSFGRSQLFRWCHHRCWEKIHVVHCGVDRIFLDANPAPTPASTRLACVGRLSGQKGQHLLLEAAAGMNSRRPGKPLNWSSSAMDPCAKISRPRSIASGSRVLSASPASSATSACARKYSQAAPWCSAVSPRGCRS